MTLIEFSDFFPLVASCFCAGFLFCDYKSRQKDIETREGLANDMRRVTLELANSHNSLATRLNELTDQVNTHEMKFSGARSKPSMFPPIKPA